MSKKESQPKSPNSNLPLINLNAAGIDIGADRHWVSVPLDRDKDCVRSFGCFTAELYALEGLEDSLAKLKLSQWNQQVFIGYLCSKS